MEFMNWFRLVMVDFVVQVAWPVLIFILVLFFRKEIGNFLERLTKLGPAGVVAAPPNQSTEKPKLPSDALSQTTLPDDPLLANREQTIRTVVDQFEADTAIGEEGAREHLIRGLAASQLTIEFERISRVIYGTQISLLRHLLSGESITRDNLSSFFKEHEDRALPYGKTNFDTWARP